MNQALAVKGLHKRYGKKTVLDDISFTSEGGILGILGENGAGKSTLIRILAGTLAQDQGEVSVYGRSAEDSSATAASRIGYLPQDFDFFRYQKLHEAMRYIAMLKGMEKDVREESEKLLRLLHLHEEKEKLVGELSGGMKQRFGIAQSLLNRPKLIILDEPTAGLDPGERINFRNVVTSLDWECAVVLSTHIIGDIESLCDKVLLLKEGRMLYYGTQEAALGAMRGKVLVVRQGEKETVRWGENVISVRKAERAAWVRMVAEGAADLDMRREDTAYADPTLEDFYFYKMYVHGGKDIHGGKDFQKTGDGVCGKKS